MDNWCRYEEVVTDSPVQARMRLLDAIEERGEILPGLPGWMTSAKPGVDAYLGFGPDCTTVLTLREGTGGNGTSTWVAVNAIAPKQGRKKPSAPALAGGGARRTSADLDDDLVQWALSASLNDVLDDMTLSVHMLQRLEQRCGLSFTDPDEVRDWLLAREALVIECPVWADGSGRGGLVIWSALDDGDELALPVGADELEERAARLVVTTALSRSWVERDLREARESVTVSRKVSRELFPGLDDETATAQAAQLIADSEIQAVRGGAIAVLGNGSRVLLKVGGGRWIARDVLSGRD